MANKKLSIIIPAYSGLETIAGTLRSVASQKLDSGIELVILQDGPHQELEHSIRQSLDSLDFKGSKIKYKVLATNVGRFQARLEGAKLASHDQLLFIDDRVELANNYIELLRRTKNNLLMGNVIEKRADNFNPIAATLSAARKTLYDSTFESKFKDYYIAASNFEKSPKGTASLYINRQLFIEICKAVVTKKSGADSRFFNEDTGLMRELIDRGHKILRTSKLVLYYRPRSNFAESVKHLYGRGPRFVDYYINPRSRFFAVLLMDYALIAAVILMVPLGHAHLGQILVILVAALALVSVVMAKSFTSFFSLLVGIPLVIGIFSAGIVKGTAIKLRS